MTFIYKYDNIILLEFIILLIIAENIKLYTIQLLVDIKISHSTIGMWTILLTSTIFYIGIMLLAVKTLEEGVLLGTILTFSTILYIIAAFISLKFEVDAGYYECKNCHHKFVPTYKEVMFSIHMGTTRHLRCPECKKRSWAKKVMAK